MSTLRLTALVATIVLGGLLLAGIAKAGDVKGTVTVQGLRSAENIVVYVDEIPGKKFEAPTQHVVINQRKMAFVPHVTAVLKGTTVDFLNSDAVGHNVYWPSISGNKKLAHNLGTWGKGEQKSFQFNDAGVAALLCNVHPEMSGYLIIVSTPYFAVTDLSGAFDIKDIPPGTYTLKTWSEDGKVTTQSVTVTTGTTTADLAVKK